MKIDGPHLVEVQVHMEHVVEKGKREEMTTHWSEHKVKESNIDEVVASTKSTALKIGPCPKCGNTTFIATAHVTQTWLVDEDGDFIEAKSDCDEVTHAPDAEDLFTCSKCGEEVTAINV